LAKYSLEYHSAAESEIYEAAEWYKVRSETAARRFAIEVDAKIELILAGPEAWPVFESGSRRILFNRFPFSIIYRTKAMSLKSSPSCTNAASLDTGTTGKARPSP
jgi:plasmid stabilization system protein ParE